MTSVFPETKDSGEGHSCVSIYRSMAREMPHFSKDHAQPRSPCCYFLFVIVFVCLFVCLLVCLFVYHSSFSEDSNNKSVQSTSVLRGHLKD